jgi:hypothetical protein
MLAIARGALRLARSELHVGRFARRRAWKRCALPVRKEFPGGRAILHAARGIVRAASTGQWHPRNARERARNPGLLARTGQVLPPGTGLRAFWELFLRAGRPFFVQTSLKVRRTFQVHPQRTRLLAPTGHFLQMSGKQVPGSDSFLLRRDFF